MTVRFSNKLVAELFQPFWAALQAGDFLTDAAAVAQTHILDACDFLVLLFVGFLWSTIMIA